MSKWVMLLWIVGHFSIVCAQRDKLVKGFVGQSVQLPCSYRTQNGRREVCWGKGRCPNSKCGDRLLQTDGSRVTFRRSWKYQLKGSLRQGNVDLTITEASEGDSGMYCCRIEVPGWFNDIKNNVHLQIRKVTTTTKRTTTTTTTCPPTTLQPTTATILQTTTATTFQTTTATTLPPTTATTLPPTTSTTPHTTTATTLQPTTSTILHTTTATALEPTTSTTLLTTSAPVRHITTVTTLQPTTTTTLPPTTTTTLHTTTATKFEPTTSPGLPTTSAPTRHITTATSLPTTPATILQGTTAPALQITTATTVQNITATPFQPTTAITLQAITTALFAATLGTETFLSTKELVTSFSSHALQTTLRVPDEETSHTPKGTSDVFQREFELDQISNSVKYNLLFIIVPLVAAGLLALLLGILLRGKVMQKYYLAKYTSFKMKKEPENILGDMQIEMNGDDNLFIL
ncbi:T-cell immunoglobulin and mucin domain-containing protein 4-like isoform X2 [Ornithorhynchus anatinus]|uniref:T-cell immunoglobulin and mucin domain-containing protein 4-like isoform X2 n=1 Tax=Ornithorhynchus anatinus TaxID=9258 RepID=UPI000454AF7D|nr:T-cell immunoglobulin and mucin domain-containing protein 4-like isoform X2 [Ornithorhynchus anatinus]